VFSAWAGCQLVLAAFETCGFSHICFHPFVFTHLFSPKRQQQGHQLWQLDLHRDVEYQPCDAELWTFICPVFVVVSV